MCMCVFITASLVVGKNWNEDIAKLMKVLP